VLSTCLTLVDSPPVTVVSAAGLVISSNILSLFEAELLFGVAREFSGPPFDYAKPDALAFFFFFTGVTKI